MKKLLILSLFVGLLAIGLPAVAMDSKDLEEIENLFAGIDEDYTAETTSTSQKATTPKASKSPVKKLTVDNIEPKDIVNLFAGKTAVERKKNVEAVLAWLNKGTFPTLHLRCFYGGNTATNADVAYITDTAIILGAGAKIPLPKEKIRVVGDICRDIFVNKYFPHLGTRKPKKNTKS